jgi:hypothetical protein
MERVNTLSPQHALRGIEASGVGRQAPVGVTRSGEAAVYPTMVRSEEHPSDVHTALSDERDPDRTCQDSDGRALFSKEICQREYEISLARRGAPGDARADWLQAETELLGRRFLGLTQSPSGGRAPRRRETLSGPANTVVMFPMELTENINSIVRSVSKNNDTTIVRVQHPREAH